MTRLAAAQGFMGPFLHDGAASVAPHPPWHCAADFTAIECRVDPSAVEALLDAVRQDSPEVN
jgi:acetoacetate decarboxylase